MPRSFFRRIPWIVAFLLIVLSGCYTVIMHPQVENERKTAEELRVDCIDCHADYHVYPYDPYDHFFGADYYWSHPRYGYYYGYPWWWDDYYWNYYYNPDNPSEYTGAPREIGRPSYRGGIPVRSGEGSSPDVHVAMPRGIPGGRSEGLGADTPGDDTTTVIPETRALDPGQRLTGQPPWSVPKGTLIAKPPSLRQGLVDDPEITPVTNGQSGGGSTVTTPPAKPAKTPPPDKKEAKKEEKKSDKPRGRPKRNPR